MRRKSAYLLAGAVPLAMVCAAAFLLNTGSAPEAPETVTSDAPSVEPASELELPGLLETDGGPDFDDETKSKLQSIAEAHEAQTQYPSFSRPIAPGELESKYRGNAPVASDLPADLSDPDSPRISILTDRFRYYPGDQLAANAMISGLAEEESSAVTAKLLRGGEVVSQASVSPASDASHSYYLDFSALQFDDVDWKAELTIRATFDVRGKRYTRSATVEYVATIARVDGVANSEVQDEYLHISVHVSSEKPGLHRLQANLYDAETGQPLVHLRGEGKVDSSGSLILKAHIAALKKAGSEGPYELKDLVLTRQPTSPNFITEYGRVDRDQYPVDQHSFDDYLDKPYENPKAERIAAELRRLGS